MTTTLVADGTPPTGSPSALPEALRSRFGHGPVLIATDGRSASDAPFIAGRLLAQRIGVGIDVLAIYQPIPIWAYAGATDVPIPPPAIDAECKADLERTVRTRAAAALGSTGWHLDVLVGDPARTIALTARQRQSAVIVAGTGGHGATARVMGEVALHVLRLADCPVLAVSPDFGGLSHHVVVGMDFSPASVRAAETALAMLESEGTLTLLHVFEAASDRANVLEHWRRTLDTGVATFFGRLREELGPLAPLGVTIETRGCTGVIVDEMMKCARETGADLLAVGTHRPGFVERLLVGSVATDVIRHAGSTVLASPPPRPAEAVRLQLRLTGHAGLAVPADWAEALDSFTQRNAGRRASLEVDDPNIGAQVEQTGYAFLGASYDRHDERVEIMLGDPANRTRHLTRTIPSVTSIGIAAASDGRDLVLCAEHGRGQTLLWLDD